MLTTAAEILVNVLVRRGQLSAAVYEAWVALGSPASFSSDTSPVEQLAESALNNISMVQQCMEDVVECILGWMSVMHEEVARAGARLKGTDLLGVSECWPLVSAIQDCKACFDSLSDTASTPLQVDCRGSILAAVCVLCSSPVVGQPLLHRPPRRVRDPHGKTTSPRERAGLPGAASCAALLLHELSQHRVHTLLTPGLGPGAKSRPGTFHCSASVATYVMLLLLLLGLFCMFMSTANEAGAHRVARSALRLAAAAQHCSVRR